MSADCLVLHIQDDSINLYIVFDALREKYCVWGKSKQVDIEDVNNKRNFIPFYYSCEKSNKKHLYSFIEFIMDTNVDISLYNFADLPNGCSEITYDLLHEMGDVENTIAFYYQQKYDDKYILHLLDILAHIRNEYHL